MFPDNESEVGVVTCKRTASQHSPKRAFYTKRFYFFGQRHQYNQVPTQVERCVGAGLDHNPIILFGSGSEACFCPVNIFLRDKGTMAL